MASAPLERPGAGHCIPPFPCNPRIRRPCRIEQFSVSFHEKGGGLPLAEYRRTAEVPLRHVLFHSGEDGSHHRSDLPGSRCIGRHPVEESKLVVLLPQFLLMGDPCRDIDDIEDHHSSGEPCARNHDRDHGSIGSREGSLVLRCSPLLIEILQKRLHGSLVLPELREFFPLEVTRV